MGLTEFGKAVRKMRIDCNQTLASMANALDVTPAFLSSVETGRKKVPETIVLAAIDFFKKNGLEQSNLHTLADVSNESVPLVGLSPRHQMLVAGFARSSLDAETLEKLAQLLESGAANGVNK